MKRRERQKKWISLVLLTVLCLASVFGSLATDVPVYASVSCALRADQNPDSIRDPVKVPVERLYQDFIARLPETEGPLERMEQNQATVLLERCRQVKRSSFRDAGASDNCVIESFRQSTGIYESVDAAETATADSQSRIIAYIHDQDGQKDDIL